MGRSPPLRPCAKYTRLKRGMNSVLQRAKQTNFFFPSPLRGSLLNTFYLWSAGQIWFNDIHFILNRLSASTERSSAHLSRKRFGPGIAENSECPLRPPCGPRSTGGAPKDICYALTWQIEVLRKGGKFDKKEKEAKKQHRPQF